MGVKMYFENGEINLYYEKTGQGNPIILLHGNGEDHKIFDVVTKQLAPNYTVYAIDSRDHGKSSEVETLNYADMSEDVVAFIRELNIENPILLGFSDGGIIGLLTAIKCPDLLSKLIVIGTNTSPKVIKKRWLIIMKMVYFFTRNRKFKLMLRQPNITTSELNSIVTPTLVLAGSKDVIPNSHTKYIAENISNSVVKILDGENHVSYVLNSEKLYNIILPFLEME